MGKRTEMTIAEIGAKPTSAVHFIGIWAKNADGSQMRDAEGNFMVRCDEKGEPLYAYLREANRMEIETAMGYTMNVTANPKYITAGEVILNACWLEGNEKLKTEYIVAAGMAAYRIINQFEAELVNC